MHSYFTLTRDVVRYALIVPLYVNAGEITTKAKVDYEAVVRRTCREIGFTSEDVGLDCDKCKVPSVCLCLSWVNCLGCHDRQQPKDRHQDYLQQLPLHMHQR